MHKPGDRLLLHWPPASLKCQRYPGIRQQYLDKWVKRWRDTGSVAALPFAGGRQRVLQEYATLIRTEVQQQPDVTLAELCERVAAQTEVTASRSMMARELQLLALPRKKR